MSKIVPPEFEAEYTEFRECMSAWMRSKTNATREEKNKAIRNLSSKKRRLGVCSYFSCFAPGKPTCSTHVMWWKRYYGRQSDGQSGV